jgi:hypothetical protein
VLVGERRTREAITSSGSEEMTREEGLSDPISTDPEKDTVKPIPLAAAILAAEPVSRLTSRSSGSNVYRCWYK